MKQTSDGFDKCIKVREICQLSHNLFPIKQKSVNVIFFALLT